MSCSVAVPACRSWSSRPHASSRRRSSSSSITSRNGHCGLTSAASSCHHQLRANVCSKLLLMLSAAGDRRRSQQKRINATTTFMCIQKPVSFTDLFVAQQVTLMTDMPAVVAGAANAPGSVQVKILGTQQHLTVSLSIVHKVSPESFKPGDAVKRATLNLEEEDATARYTPVVSVESPELATIRLSTGVVYQSRTYRLRPAAVPVATAASQQALLPPPRRAGEPWIPPVLLEPIRLRTPAGFQRLLAALAAAPPRCRKGAMRKLVSSIYPGVETVAVNDGAVLAPTGPLGAPFLQAAARGASALPHVTIPSRPPTGASAAGKEGAPPPPPVVVDFLLHGTAATNIEPIFKLSVVSQRPCGRCWFTRDPATALEYAKTRGGAASSSAVLCAVLLRPEHEREQIVTTAAKEYHLPLAHVKLPR